MTIDKRPLREERYTKGAGAAAHTLNFVVYASTTGPGNDEVLQHKMFGTELAHITLHPDGTVNVREKRSANELKQFVATNLQGFTPAPSDALKAFLAKVRTKI